MCKYEDEARKFESVVQEFVDKETLKPEYVKVLFNCEKFKRHYGKKEDGIVK
jgi:hypothetical protein